MNQSNDYKIKCLKYNIIYNQNIFGILLYSFNGVCAYSNDNNKYISNEINYHNGNFTGIKWQCVEYVRRYIQTVFDITFSQVDSAYQIPNAIFSKIKDNKIIQPTIYRTEFNMPINLESLNNSLIIWPKDYETDAPHGHVAVIVYAHDDGIHVAEQNYNNNNFYRYIPWDNIKDVNIIIF